MIKEWFEKSHCFFKSVFNRIFSNLKAAPPPPPSGKAPQKDEKSARKGISLQSLIKDSDKDDKKNDKSKNLETPKSDSKRSDRIRTAEKRSETGDRRKSLSPSNASEQTKRKESKYFY